MENSNDEEYLIDVEKHANLSISKTEDVESILKISRALSSPERIQILKTLYLRSTTLADLSKELHIPISSMSRHVDILADAQLIRITYRPTLKGHMKYCSLKMLSCKVSLKEKEQREKRTYSLEMPIGMFSHADILPPCGIVSKNAIIGIIDDPRTFYLPKCDYRHYRRPQNFLSSRTQSSGKIMVCRREYIVRFSLKISQTKIFGNVFFV